ncbi:serine/threonine-protein phosphatase 4 regulatory subunit 1 [Nematostella vectensis]|uniref:serine/threonine-protein phosphatase 4 regulatory subunit 1 n=1 Tax=Nematostella vectensis TaxID=45351 RepID=UPI0020776338|nr:serine/threonine-protein phosphatase 4 regulatory subunit 1 [Nematostella vectensis]
MHVYCNFKMADIRFLVEDIDDADDDQDDGCDMEQDDPSVLDQIGPEELLSPIIRMEKYMHSDVIFNRQMAARYTKEALKACRTKDDIYHVLRLIVRLSEDIEPCVRVELMDQIPHVALFCYEHYSMMEAVPQYILYIVLRYLMDSNNQVRKASQQVLLELLEHELVERADVEDQVCPVLMQLTAGDSSDDYRSEAVTLMSKMSSLVGKDITERFFMPRFEVLCSDPLFHVRKVCASSFGEICNVVGPELTTDKLLPVFFRLCQDGVWGVRKSCAETFMSVSAASPEEVRGNDLAEVFISLLCDKSRWVQMAAYQNLGPFISTFANPAKSGFYIDDYGMLCPVPRSEEARTAAESTTYENTASDEGVDSSSSKDHAHRERGSSPEATTTDSGYISPPDMATEHADTCQSNKDGSCDLEAAHGNCSSTNSYDSCQSDSQSDNCQSSEGNCQSMDKGSNCQSTDKGSNCQSTEKSDSCQSSEKSRSSNGCTVSGFCSVPTTDLDADLDENYFNSFLYWRSPLPQVEVELDSINDKDKEDDDGDEDDGDGNDKTEDLQMKSSVQGSTNKSEALRQTPPKSPHLSFGHNSDSDEEEHMPIFSLTDDPHDFDYDDYHELKLRRSSSYDDDLLLDGMVTPHQDMIPQNLLDHYISMTEPTKAQTIDTEIARHCAFSFPAVTLTLGRENWACLRDTYELLASDMQWKVRRTLAFSIHELAQVLGEDLTKTELVPTFNSFLKDLDEVRIGVLKHLADFIKLLPLDVRVGYLPVLVEFLSTDNNRNWRFRQELAEQLMYLSDLYTPAAVQQFICPIAITLATDRVADVRTIAFRLIGVLLRRLHGCKDDSSVRKFVSDIIIKFAHSQQWTRRQAYAQLCQNMLEENAESGPHFCEEFLPNLLSLLSDKVPNVRLAVARTLTHSVLNCDYLQNPECKERDIVTGALRKLQSDSDRDVRYFAGSKEDWDENREYSTQGAHNSSVGRECRKEGSGESGDNTEQVDMEEEGIDTLQTSQQIAHLENQIAEELSKEFQDNSNMELEKVSSGHISIVGDEVSSSTQEVCEEKPREDGEAKKESVEMVAKKGDMVPDTAQDTLETGLDKAEACT